MKKIVIIIGALHKGSFSRKLVKERSMSPVISSEAFICHFERACPLSLPAEHGFCHFERSPKGGVEKSDYRQSKQAKASPRTEGRSLHALRDLASL